MNFVSNENFSWKHVIDQVLRFYYSVHNELHYLLNYIYNYGPKPSLEAIVRSTRQGIIAIIVDILHIYGVCFRSKPRPTLLPSPLHF